MVLLAMLSTSPNATNWAAISPRLQRLSFSPFSLGKLQARAVACACTSGGKTLGSTRTRQVFQTPGFHPAPPPETYSPIGAAHLASNLLVAPFRVLMGCQNDLGTHHFPLRGFPGLYQPAQLSHFVVKELDRILGLRSRHGLFLQPQVYRLIRNQFMQSCTKNKSFPRTINHRLSNPRFD